ncbi:hypothetical protein Q3G72_001428 [Acer saccharum]|nr:hypothetical protein Q3G72_001428 [Acer saccharum]
MLPVQMAASLGDENMVKCLYDPNNDHLNDDDRIRLLLTLIENNIYDYAWSMVEKFPRLAVFRAQKTDGNGEKTDGNVETALHALARKPLMKFKKFGISKGRIPRRFCYRFMNTIVEKKKMDPKALKLLELLWKKIVTQQDYNQISVLITKPLTLISDAVKQGNFEFISILINKQPDVIFNVDENRYTLFHTAVEYRQEKIFKLIYEKPSIKNVIVALTVGEEDNTILHLAAKLPPDQNRLKVVSGAALQMQRELWWFKEVRKLMPPSYAGAKNKKGETAQTLFTESHTKLMKQGEEWMKTTANSCMIVATLIATIVFAAAFTLPGGIKDDTGDPQKGLLYMFCHIRYNITGIILLLDSNILIYSYCKICGERFSPVTA